MHESLFASTEGRLLGVGPALTGLFMFVFMPFWMTGPSDCARLAHTAGVVPLHKHVRNR